MSRKAKEVMVKDGYDINIVGRNLLVTDSMKDYAIEKIGKIEKFQFKIREVDVTMDIQKLEHRVDIVLFLDHTKIKAHAESDSMYASIDIAADKIETQIRRYKNRISDHHAKKLSTVDMNVHVFKKPDEEILEEVNLDIEYENSKQLIESYVKHEIVTQEKLPLKMLTLDEAMMKMDLSGDSFLIFRGEEDQKLKVIYRRRDENFGVIEVEG